MPKWALASLILGSNKSQSTSGTVTLVINWFEELNQLVPTDP